MRLAILYPVLLLAALALPVAAHADTFSFIPTSGTTETFTLPATPSSDNSTAVIYSNVTPDIYDVEFYVGATHGGIDLYMQIDSTQYFETGAQLFTGSTSSPNFTLGSFTLAPYGNGTPGLPGTLVISSGTAIGPAPEPSSMILFGTGLLTLAAVARSRARNA